jgi:predicted ATP-grasp superfamily ATP-dependent carboligase
MLKLAGSVVVQEWIDGPELNLFFTLFTCDSRGEVQAIFSGRKIVCSPPGVGNTALCIAAPDEAPVLERLTRNFIQLSDFRGLGSMEYKRDARTQEFVIIEPTVGRTDWQEEIATLSGVNIPLAEYRSILGLPVGQMRPKAAGVAWQASMRHRPTPGILPEGTRVQGGHFRPEDPGPALFHYGYERFAGRAFRLIKRAIKGEPLHASV